MKKRKMRKIIKRQRRIIRNYRSQIDEMKRKYEPTKWDDFLTDGLEELRKVPYHITCSLESDGTTVTVEGMPL